VSRDLSFDNVLVTGAGGLLGRYVIAELSGHCAVMGFDLRRPEGEVSFIDADVTDLRAVRQAVAGKDAVVHIAALANIWAGSGEDIVRVNVMGTWNVLQAAEEAGVRRVVLCSSDSVVGFTVASSKVLPPLYLPIDEAHPLRPTDPYALSKKLGEEAGRSFAQRGALQVVVLRPVFVLYPEMEGEVIARAENPKDYKRGEAGGPNPAGGGPVWHYVDPRDAARAFHLALQLESVDFDVFFVSARNTLAPEPTLERLRNFLGELPEVRRPELYRKSPWAPLYDLSRVHDVLGFEAEHDRRPLLYGADVS
jgi:nucleoside-diphosphate-sugar epimerase